MHLDALCTCRSLCWRLGALMQFLCGEARGKQGELRVAQRHLAGARGPSKRRPRATKQEPCHCSGLGHIRVTFSTVTLNAGFNLRLSSLAKQHRYVHKPATLLTPVPHRPLTAAEARPPPPLSPQCRGLMAPGRQWTSAMCAQNNPPRHLRYPKLLAAGAGVSSCSPPHVPH